jgi:hypothetical protein
MIADGWQTKLRLFAHNAQSRLCALTMPFQRVCTAYGAELRIAKENAANPKKQGAKKPVEALTESR